jgi:CheY-like chemotaxis protein
MLHKFNKNLCNTLSKFLKKNILIFLTLYNIYKGVIGIMDYFTNKKKRILVVDDSEIDLDLVEMMLQDKYTILPTKSGKEALNYLIHNNNVDLILLDLIMPEMDGWETFSRIKNLGIISNVPIAFLTSVHGTEEQKHAKGIGAADYIFKPYTKEELLKMIKAIIKKNKNHIERKYFAEIMYKDTLEAKEDICVA